MKSGLLASLGRGALLGAMMTMTTGLLTGEAQALDKVKFGTDWVAQAEHGGFYQAKAMGIYEKFGLDVEIVPGGPQVNNPQLVATGVLDLASGGDIVGPEAWVQRADQQGVENRLIQATQPLHECEPGGLGRRFGARILPARPRPEMGARPSRPVRPVRAWLDGTVRRPSTRPVSPRGSPG